LTRTGLCLALLWAAFLVRGVWYCALLPLWEGYDEPYHFAALQNVAAGQGMPHSDTRITLEVEESLHLAPIPWEMQYHAVGQAAATYEAFWTLPLAEREKCIEALRALDPRDGSRPANGPVFNYESQQPPLYYWVMALPMRWSSGMQLLSRLYLLRIVGLLLASLMVPLTYWIANGVLRSEPQALGTVAILALLPELAINLARVSNESLAVVCYSSMVAAALYALRKPAAWCGWFAFGVCLGCGLLSKSYVLSAIPGVFVVGHFAYWRAPGNETPKLGLAGVLGRMAAALAVAMAIAGPWYWRMHAATGSWTGTNDEANVARLSLLQNLVQVGHVNWKSGALSVAVSHVWFGAWSFLRLPTRVYVVAFIVMAVAACGIVVRLMRRRDSMEERREVAVLCVFYVGFLTGLAYHVLINYLGHGVSASAGWYLYATVAAEVVLLVWGLLAFVSPRICFIGLAVGVAALDLYGMHALLMPYYAGLSAHVGDWVPPSLRVTAGNLPVVFERLGMLRPAWLGAGELWACWIGYWVATLGTVAGVVAMFRRAAVNE
jgi:4-amino-4-deoxy-L-arabinose transferase-like glycosyltransferase